jgi:hypothetical protein
MASSSSWRSQSIRYRPSGPIAFAGDPTISKLSGTSLPLVLAQVPLAFRGQ